MPLWRAAGGIRRGTGRVDAYGQPRCWIETNEGSEGEQVRARLEWGMLEHVGQVVVDENSGLTGRSRW